MSLPDDGLFARLTAFREDVFRVCLGFSRNAADAEDWCHDVFIKAFSRAGSLRDPSATRIWLLRIARTTSLDHCRRRRRFPTMSIDAAPDPVSEGVSPESAGDAAAGLGRIKAAVRALPPKHREIFVLREYAGLSYEDLGRTLRLRPGTVMSRLNRARRAVAAAVEGFRHG